MSQDQSRLLVEISLNRIGSNFNHEASLVEKPQKHNTLKSVQTRKYKRFHRSSTRTTYFNSKFKTKEIRTPRKKNRSRELHFLSLAFRHEKLI